MIAKLIAVALLLAAGETPPDPEEGSKTPFSIDPVERKVYPTPPAPQPHPPAPTPPAPKRRQPLRLEVAIHLLEENGRPPRAMDPERTTFREGDRIQLRLASSTSGYAAVAQIGSDGTASLLFPAPELGFKSARIEPAGSVTLPSKHGAFEFDAQPGTETLVVLLAGDPSLIDDLVRDFDRAKLDAWVARERPKDGSKNLRTVKTDGCWELAREDGTPIIEVLKLEHR